MATETTKELVQAYYDSWKNGIDTFDEARVRRTLGADVTFEGPIAGIKQGIEAYLPGLRQFVTVLKGFRLVHLVVDHDEAAALYDGAVSVPTATVRFAEFFHVSDDRIQALRLVFDVAAFKSLVAR